MQFLVVQSLEVNADPMHVMKVNVSIVRLIFLQLNSVTSRHVSPLIFSFLSVESNVLAMHFVVVVGDHMVTTYKFKGIDDVCTPNVLKYFC